MMMIHLTYGYHYSKGEDKMKNIAVIIPTYNAHKTIKKTLHSLACQLNKSFRVYLAVDGEPEGTYDYLLNQFDTLDMEILYCPMVAEMLVI